jgi:hypothetical protein
MKKVFGGTEGLLYDGVYGNDADPSAPRSERDRAAGRRGQAARDESLGALSKFCAQTFLSHFEKHGGIASLPPNWRELLSRLDGRRNQVIQFNGPNSGPVSQSMAADIPGKYRSKKKGKK